MQVVVRVRSTYQGEWVFWQGDEANVSEIPCARPKKLAQSVVRTRKPKAFGIWHVTIENNETSN